MLVLYIILGILAANTAAAQEGSAAATGSSASTTAQVDEQGRPCKIVRQKSSRDGTLSSRVTAGGGKVTAETNAPNSVTVHSGNGGASSSVTTGGSGGSSAAVATGDGDCIITIPEDAPKQPGEN